MNKWTKLSIEYASHRSYLDDLFAVYPIIPDGIRENKMYKSLAATYKNYNIMSASVLKNYLYQFQN
jgi:hypothetical protein